MVDLQDDYKMSNEDMIQQAKQQYEVNLVRD